MVDNNGKYVPRQVVFKTFQVSLTHYLDKSLTICKQTNTTNRAKPIRGPASPAISDALIFNIVYSSA